MKRMYSLHLPNTFFLRHFCILTLVSLTVALKPNLAPPPHPLSKRLSAYNFESSYARWQIQSASQSATQARVTTTDWSQTPDQVTATINNFNNIPPTNIPLWRQGSISTLVYCGFFTCSVMSMNPQPGLNGDNVVASLILPSGVAKLAQVGPYRDELGQNAQVAGIFGIALIDAGNPLVPADYAYIKNLNSDGTGLKPALQAYKVQYSAYQGSGRNKPTLPVQVPALTGDGETVVINFNEIVL